MLPDLRFVFGALTLIAVTGMIGVGLFVSARLFHQAKVGPLESSRNLAFTDSAEWNQFHDAGSVRRYVGLAPQGAPLETSDMPPAERGQAAAPAALAVDLAPVDVAVEDDGTDALPLSSRPAAAETKAPVVAPAAEIAPAIAAPAMLVPSGRTGVGEHAADLDAETAADIEPDQAETVIPHRGPLPVRSAPSAAEEGPPAEAHSPEVTAGSIARAVAIANDAAPNTLPITDDEVSEAEAVTGKVATAPAASENALPQPRTIATPATAQPPAAPARSVAPAAAARAPVNRTVPDDEDERPRVASRPRSRALAARPRTAPTARAPHRQGTQRVDPRPLPSGQPVFGPNFPYGPPQRGQPVFGPHFPYATPQARRQPAARAPQYRAYSQPSYGPAYGRR